MTAFFLRSPNKGFWACLLPPAMPRRPETWVSLCNLSSGRIVPRVTITRVTPFIPHERPIVKHSIASYLRLPRHIPVSALIWDLHWRTRHWQSARRLWPDMRRLQFPLDYCCRLMLPYNAVQHATDGTDP